MTNDHYGQLLVFKITFKKQIYFFKPSMCWIVVYIIGKAVILENESETDKPKVVRPICKSGMVEHNLL